MVQNFYIENDIRNQYFRMHEIFERYEGKAPNGCTLIVGNDMVKYPARFIQYCLSLCNIQGIFIDGSTKNWEVIDGNKRIRTIINFIENKFPLEDGKYFKDIEGFLKDRIKSSIQIQAFVLNPGATDKDLIKKYIKEVE